MESSRSLFVCLSTSLVGAFVFFAAGEVDAAGNTCSWTGPSDGVWSDPGNWSCTSPGSVPGAGDTAVFPENDAGGPVEISGQQAVGSIDVTRPAYSFGPEDDGGLTIGTSASFAGGTGHEFYLTVPIAIASPVTFSIVTLGTSASVYMGPIAFSPGGSLTTQGTSFATNGPITGPGMLVVSSGLLLVESPLNTYSGGSQILSGTLYATNLGALGSGPVAVGAGTLSIDASGAFLNALSLGTRTSEAFLSVQPQGSEGVVSGDVVWAGPVQLAGTANIQATDFVISGSITDSVPGGAVLTFSNTGEVSANGVVTPIELASPNSAYAGGTIVASGGGGAVLADYGSSFGTGPITILGGPEINAGIVELADGVTLANPIDVPGGLLLSNGSSSVTGPITGQGIVLGAGTDGATLTVAGTLTGSADSYGYGLYVYGAWIVSSGTGNVLLDLASPATYAGHTGISAATLDLGSQPNALPPSTEITFMYNNGTPAPGALAVHANTQVGGLEGCGGAGLITLDHGAILTIAMGDPANPTQCYSGTMMGDGGLTFTGDGGNSFPGTTEDGGYVAGDFAYAYEGPTRVEGNPATLPTVLKLHVDQFDEQWNGSIPNSTITVAGGGELDFGPGSTVGPVVGAGGTIVPYPGPATTPDAGAASLALSADTNVRAVYAGPDAGTSFLAVHGGISLGSAALVATRATGLLPQGPVVVLANLGDASVDGTFAGLPEGAVFTASGGALRISYVGGDGNDVTLEVPLLDGGSEGGAPSDAGEDAMVADAAPDAMGGASDGGPPSDASLDAGLPYDAGGPDAQAIADGAPPLEDGSLTPGEPSSGGCGCQTTGAGGGSQGVILGLAAIALVGLRRRRRAAA